MSVGKTFFDTNVLLYMHSAADPRKQALAQQVFQECLATGRVVLSTQVVQEFHAAGSRKMAIPHDALRILTTALLDLPLVHVGPAHIRKALWGEEHYQV
jgi:predicted nucleic acid-binding protein